MNSNSEIALKLERTDFLIIYWGTGVILLADLTLLLINDHFPGTLDALGIPMWALFAVLAALVAASIITRDPEREKRHRLFTMSLLFLYPTFMLALLPLLGGESQSGVSLKSPFLWLLMLFTLWTNWREYVKESREDTQQT